MSSGTGVSEGVVKTVGDLKKNGRAFKRDNGPAYAIKLNNNNTEFVEDEEFTVEIKTLFDASKANLPESLPPTAGSEEFGEQRNLENKIMDSLLNHFGGDWSSECRYVLMDVLNARNNSNLVCFRWNPDSAAAKKKMVFASGASGLKGKLDLKTVLQVDTMDELKEKIEAERAKN